MAEKAYITTAIDYVNARPHIGHAYQKIVADALSRWNRMVGRDVFFLTGTDEHGKKVENAAKAAGKDPKEFVDEVSLEFKLAWKRLSINYDRFIRTTDPDHIDTVRNFILKCHDAGDIYKGKYSGHYCVDCEMFYTESECPDNICPVHKRKLEFSEEETYFFRLSKYQKFLLKLYDERPEFVLPEVRRNEMVSRVSEGLKDLSISRKSLKWGIPFPLDESHSTYVWFDALINYYTATRGKGRESFWGKPAVHILGKDNTWFHAVCWPAMLMSANLELPGKTLNHGFLSFNGQKISKSLGNAISPVVLTDKYGADSVRYFCLRQFPFAEGSDGDFNEDALVSRHNDELADKYGNLFSRIIGLIEKNGIEESSKSILVNLDVEKIKELYDNYEIDKAINEVFTFIDYCNGYLQKSRPWETGDGQVLFELLWGFKAATILLYPVIPNASSKVSELLDFKMEIEEIFKPVKLNKIPKKAILFNKLEL